MFGRLRDPRGGATLLMAGIAALALSGFLLLTPVPFPVNLLLSGTSALAGLGCVIGWASRQRAQRYDLDRLWDAPAPNPDEPEEPYEDTLPAGEEAAPYCGWCDEAYPPGTPRCLRCNRELG